MGICHPNPIYPLGSFFLFFAPYPFINPLYGVNA